ncbi:hypothetical protein LIER_06473 [Lithospermum erythrorhizon]|uniref:Transposase (putative) gypsy type domain-containing protein n=1 Tax=Lithospermum erythrorhizon TaxID=34254 RepID=A0AAV3P6A7_LITER
MRISFVGETIDNPMVNTHAPKGDPMESGYVPICSEFLNYGLSLPSSSFINSVLIAIDLTPCQIGPFAWATLTAFQVGCLSVGVVSSLNLFSRIFNVAHTGVLMYFHICPKMKNMLYHGKPGKVSPTRWHKFWLLIKDAFSDEVRSTFSTDSTSLEYEKTPKVAVELKKLIDGFPETIAMDVFCDPDVLIKVGLSRGHDNFPGVDLATLLKLKEGKVVVRYQVSYLEVISGNRLLNEMLAPELPTLSTPDPPSGVIDHSKGPKERSSSSLPTPTPADQQALNSEVVSPSIHPFRRYCRPKKFPIGSPPGILMRGLRRLRRIFPLGPVKRGVFDNNNPYFIDLPYTLPSGVEITAETVSTLMSSAAVDILKNYLLRPLVLGVLGTPPSSLFDRFSYHYLKTMAVAYTLSLCSNASSQHDEEVARLKATLASVEKERDDAYPRGTSWLSYVRSRARNAQVRELDFDLTKSHYDVREFTHKCGDMEIKIVDLQRALDNSIDRFKRSEEYHILLKGDTDTLLRSFGQKVARDFPGISSYFDSFVAALGEDYVVSRFDELPEEEPADSDDDSDENEADNES